jgi:hypothetical protein
MFVAPTWAHIPRTVSARTARLATRRRSQRSGYAPSRSLSGNFYWFLVLLVVYGQEPFLVLIQVLDHG